MRSYSQQMDARIRRGLGLLVVAVIAFLVLWSVAGIDTNAAWRALIELVAGLALLGALFGGLGLLAYGLLRKAR